MPKNPHIIKGVSDIIGVYKSTAIFLEVKTPRNRKRVSEYQEFFLGKVKEHGAISAVVTSIEDVEDVLLKVENKIKKLLTIVLRLSSLYLTKRDDKQLSKTGETHAKKIIQN